MKRSIIYELFVDVAHDEYISVLKDTCFADDTIAELLYVEFSLRAWHLGNTLLYNRITEVREIYTLYIIRIYLTLPQ